MIKNIKFTDEAAAVNQYARELKNMGVKAIVVLAHMDASMNGDQVVGPTADLANKLDADSEVDVILAAHNHKVVNGVVNGRLILQAYEYGKAIGSVDLTIDPLTEDIIQKSGEVVFIDQSKVTPDPRIKVNLQNFLTTVDDLKKMKVGSTVEAMTGGYTSTGDNPLGNLIADSMKWAMNSDFAMMNGGGIRTNLESGDITMGQLFTILPFNNFVEKVEIKGSDLIPILNNQISLTYGGDFSISGFKYTWDTSNYNVTNINMPDGSPIDPNKTYTLAVNNFMATSTGFKYAEIGKHRSQTPNIGDVDSTALVNYIKSFEDNPVPKPALGRIISTTSNITPSVTGNVYVSSLVANNLVKVYSTVTNTVYSTATVAAGKSYVNLTSNSADQIYVTFTTKAGSTESPKYLVSMLPSQINPTSAVFANTTNGPKSLTVQGLEQGNVVRVYESPFNVTPLTVIQVPAGQTSVLSNLNIADSVKTVYITLTKDGQTGTLEGRRTPIKAQ
jgi:hypothetical protein